MDSPEIIKRNLKKKNTENGTLSEENAVICIQKSDCILSDDDGISSSAESKIPTNTLDEIENWRAKGSKDILLPVQNT